MATETFLAMTAAEIRGSSSLPPKIGWMACHFSPYTVGLSNRPTQLPPDSLVILNDITPIHGHDKEVIAAQLEECVENLKCSAVLLDFQRPGCEETAALAAYLAEVLPCPVIISEAYATGLDCPVLLPPVPHHIPLEEYLSPWQGRQMWLELAMDGEVITLTEKGSAIASLSDIPVQGHKDAALHCHYHVEIKKDCAEFALWRSREDMADLLAEAEQLGISRTVGLYQEFDTTKKYKSTL